MRTPTTVIREALGCRIHLIDNAEFISVSSVLRLCGFGPPPEIPQHIMDAAAEKGRLVHSLTELDDEGELDEASVDPALAGYLAAWRKFRTDTDFVHNAIEEQVHYVDDSTRVFGYLDRRGEYMRREPAHREVLDIKSGSHVGDAAKLQLALYMLAVGNGYGRRVVQVKADGRYVSHPFTDDADYRDAAALARTAWRRIRSAR